MTRYGYANLSICVVYKVNMNMYEVTLRGGSFQIQRIATSPYTLFSFIFGVALLQTVASGRSFAFMAFHSFPNLVWQKLGL